MSFRMSSIQYMNNYKSSLNKTYQQQAKILEQGDGTSIHRGSDDPIGYSKLLRYNVSGSENDQYQKNVKNGISWMQTSDGIVASISDRMKTFSEKTVAAANTYNTEADFQSIAKEMFAQVEEIVSEANTQLGDRYIFSGQKDTTEPFVLSHDTYDRGIAKTLDAKQAAFFKGASGDGNGTLYQFLTVEYTDTDTGATDTYYLDTQSGYIYAKDFVDEGYKELIAQGYKSINDTDKISSTAQRLAKTYAAGSISPMTVEDAWKIVDAASEDDLLETIRTFNVNDLSDIADEDEQGRQKTLRTALRVIYDNDYGTVTTNLANAKSDIISNLQSVPADDVKYNCTFGYTVSTYNSNLGGWRTTYYSFEMDGVYSESEYNAICEYLQNQNPGYNFSNSKGDPVTDVSWNTYDSSVGDLSTDAIVVSAVDWNASSDAKARVVDHIITAIDEYAKDELYETVLTDVDNNKALADDVTKNILKTLKADVPASTSRTDIGVDTATDTKVLELAEDITDTQAETLARAELIYLATNKSAPYELEKFKVSHAFNSQGLIHDSVEEDTMNGYVKYERNTNGKFKVIGMNITTFTVDDAHNVTEDADKKYFSFATIEQRMVNYMGDDNYISMVKMNGANDKSSDIVNLNGNDLFGCDIFDDENSGNEQSGCAMLNNMLTVYTFTNGCDEHWLTSDGVTLSDVAHATVTVAETTLGSRLNLYNSVSEMLDNQSTTITNDITNVSGTDVADLATRLMEITTLYNMSLALGGRVLPQSLADYL